MRKNRTLESVALRLDPEKLRLGEGIRLTDNGLLFELTDKALTFNAELRRDPIRELSIVIDGHLIHKITQGSQYRDHWWAYQGEEALRTFEKIVRQFHNKKYRAYVSGKVVTLKYDIVPY